MRPLRSSALLLVVTLLSLTRCGGAVSSQASAEDQALAAVTYAPPFQWMGIIGTGQSVSVGTRGTPIIDNGPSANNLELEDQSTVGPNYSLTGGDWALVPLSEPPRQNVLGPFDLDNWSQYPNNVGSGTRGETPHWSLGNELSVLARAHGGTDQISAHSVVGWPSHCLDSINKEGVGGVVGRPYPASIHEAHLFEGFAKRAHVNFGYGAVVLTHGECDARNPDYGAQLVQFQQDYDRDLRAITGQTQPVRLFASQQSSRTPEFVDHRWMGSSLELLTTSEASGGTIVVTGPKYQLPYADDHIHLVAAGYRALGEKTAQVIDRVVNLGQAFRPLSPLVSQVTLAGRVITVPFHVPAPPLAFEASLLPPHQVRHAAWKNGRGFEVRDSTGELVIESVRIDGTHVVITLAQRPTGTNLRVSYAVTADVNTDDPHAGLPTGMRGQLRDSDPYVGSDAEVINCDVTRGSASVVCNPDFLTARAERDRVTASGLDGAGAVVTDIHRGQVTLSEPWTGPTGRADLRFLYDLRNYCVHFDFAVP